MHAIYWAYIVSSHISVGDVTPVNAIEKLYTCIIMYISVFIMAVFLGNLTIMVDDLDPILEKNFKKLYKLVINTI